MIQLPNLAVGDPVEILRLAWDGKIGSPEWRPATVVFVKDREVGVAFANHQRQVVPRKTTLIRQVRKP